MGTTPALTPFQRRLLRQRIPDRLFEVHFCRQIIRVLNPAYEKAKKGKAATIEEVKLVAWGNEYAIYPSKMFRYVALDAGIMMCRALLNFLGIYYISQTGLLGRRTPRDTDVSITAFRRPALTVDAACDLFPETDPSEIKRVLLITLETADIGIGHLTRTAARDIAADLTAIAAACDLVIALINKHLYEALDQEPVAFDGPNASRYFQKRGAASR